MNLSGDSAQLLAMLAAFFSLAVTIFWMVVGWRAMRAHERLADASEKSAGMPAKPEYPIDKSMV